MQPDDDLTRIRARDDDIARFRETRAWRTGSLLTDLWHWRDHTLTAPAVIAHRAGGRRIQLSYQEYSDWVDRFAAALLELGAGPGTVVAVQMPDRWQASALILAAIRTGSVVAPIRPTFGALETEQILRRVHASIYIGPNDATPE